MNESKSKKQLIEKRWTKIALGFMGLFLSLYLAYLLTPLRFIVDQAITPNYAEQIAKPIEDALIKSGATKINGSGDSGAGIDNNTPGYTSLFSVPMNEVETTQLVKRVSLENNFILKEATKDDKGPLNSIADQYLGGIYYDFTSRQANITALKSGPIKYWVDINKNNADTDQNKTTVQLDFELPEFK